MAFVKIKCDYIWKGNAHMEVGVLHHDFFYEVIDTTVNLFISDKLHQVAVVSQKNQSFRKRMNVITHLLNMEWATINIIGHDGFRFEDLREALRMKFATQRKLAAEKSELEFEKQVMSFLRSPDFLTL